MGRIVVGLTSVDLLKLSVTTGAYSDHTNQWRYRPAPSSRS